LESSLNRLLAAKELKEVKVSSVLNQAEKLMDKKQEPKKG
tara:strand:+ start:400 stop:519 length:120 start_codon:yes stop_codon:yes gene_type:complete